LFQSFSSMKRQIVQAGLILALPGLLLGCGPTQTTSTSEAPQTETQTATSPDAAEAGTLQVFANGEERPQVGFTSSDGWDLTFENIYVHFSELKAYQTEQPYDATAGAEIQNAAKEVELEAGTVDLVTGNEDDPTVLVSEVSGVEPGHYNAISWRMSPASDGPAEGYSMVIVGTAERDGETVDFVLNVDREFAYYCGDFVGDERKGFVEPGDSGELEATFHFDHLFGEGSNPADDPLNLTALGFDPIAALATDGRVEADLSTLQANLSPEDYDRLEAALVELGHAGEGHCYEAVSGQSG
jgi:hypothetical protein